MTEIDAMISEADKLARVADAISASYARELSRVLKDLERSLRTLAEEALMGSRGALARGVRAAKLRKEIQLALKAAGYADLVSTGASRLDLLVVQMERIRGAAKLAAFTSSDLTRILALKKLAEADLLQKGASIAHALWRTLVQGIYSQRPAKDLIEDLADALDIEEQQARSLYDTAVNVFGRQVEAMKSTADDVFVYMGPADVKLRPFCRQHVGKVFTRPEIDALDNGQLPNVFLTGGGYNCRHTFHAVSKLSELRELVGTDQRVPEIEAQLARPGVDLRRAA
jgi:hypothetical protein